MELIQENKNIVTKKRTALYCFSPPVMLATFVVEVSLIAYTLWRYKLNTISKIATSILGFLAIFQLSEYMVCGGTGIFGDYWARLGFISITMLPPLGIHLATEIAGKKQQYLAWISYGAALIFVAYFLLISNAIEHEACGGNYVIFNLTQSVSWLYGLYYYGLLLTGIVYCLLQSSKSNIKKVKKSLRAFATGYILFLLPTATINLIDPSTTRAIPSIMCGFAVILAFVIVFLVLPNTTDFRKTK